MANQRFVQQIDEFINTAQKNTDQIYKESIIAYGVLASTPESQGGNMPVDTGELRNSICVTSDGGSSTGVDAFAIAVLSASALSGMTIAWNAPHAPFLEFGTSKITPRAFARLAADRFSDIVEQKAREINV